MCKYVLIVLPGSWPPSKDGLSPSTTSRWPGIGGVGLPARGSHGRAGVAFEADPTLAVLLNDQSAPGHSRTRNHAESVGHPCGDPNLAPSGD